MGFGSSWNQLKIDFSIFNSRFSIRLLPGQLPPPTFFIELGQHHRPPESLQTRQLPQLRVLPERVIDVHPDGDQTWCPVEEAEIDDVVAEELRDRVTED